MIQKSMAMSGTTANYTLAESLRNMLSNKMFQVFIALLCAALFSSIALAGGDDGALGEIWTQLSEALSGAPAVKGIERMINQLGAGKSLDDAALFTGPRELRSVGKRIIWLSERLAWLESQRHQFLRHLSHELKTPLASMREGTELLADRCWQVTLSLILQ